LFRRAARGGIFSNPKLEFSGFDNLVAVPAHQPRAVAEIVKGTSRLSPGCSRFFWKLFNSRARRAPMEHPRKRGFLVVPVAINL